MFVPAVKKASVGEVRKALSSCAPRPLAEIVLISGKDGYRVRGVVERCRRHGNSIDIERRILRTRIDILLEDTCMAKGTRAEHAVPPRMGVIPGVLRLAHVLQEMKDITKGAKCSCPVPLARQLLLVIRHHQVLKLPGIVLPHQRCCRNIASLTWPSPK